ncbi:MAG: putative UDP-N-acetylglucosamine diphosphorylase [Puniceicoccaceae bacterium 5H]|nr:MAG: putative UDP-N-acetylglucosamine diphosphorylase [Puniceicoccaceae bacterium 5H]
MIASDLFDWPESLPFGDVFAMDVEPWRWLPLIKEALAGFDFGAHSQRPDLPSGLHIEGDVYLHPSAKLPPYGYIKGPVYIGPECQLRPGVYIRGNVIAGKGSVLGNSCEYKNCLLLENVETPHYNYVGDSILGNRAHLGAGVICANLKLARDEVKVRLGDDERVPTGLRKLGAILGDGAEVGCNGVLQPGSILGRRAAVISCVFQGYLPAGKLVIPDTQYRIVERPD